MSHFILFEVQTRSKKKKRKSDDKEKLQKFCFCKLLIKMADRFELFLQIGALTLKKIKAHKHFFFKMDEHT